MIKQIEKIIETKIREIGFNFNIKQLWEKEMISINFSAEDSYCFPTWNCVYYDKNQKNGTIEFRIRFSKNNEYLDYIDLDCDFDIHIYLDN